MDAVLSLDLGGTKLNSALVNHEGKILFKKHELVHKAGGEAAGHQICAAIEELLQVCHKKNLTGTGIGIAIPGQVIEAQYAWAPNIPEWEKYPLKKQVQAFFPKIEFPVIIISDRQGYAEGEHWQGAAKNVSNFICIAVGTGIGAGIFINGAYYNGQYGLAGSLGWLSLEKNHEAKYKKYGCFEYHASGEGIKRTTIDKLKKKSEYSGVLSSCNHETLTVEAILDAYNNRDAAAREVFREFTIYWGMAIANSISLMDSEMVILGGGIFGPASIFLDAIRKEVKGRISPSRQKTIKIVISELGNEGVLLGTARAVFKHQKNQKEGEN